MPIHIRLRSYFEAKKNNKHTAKENVQVPNKFHSSLSIQLITEHIFILSFQLSLSIFFLFLLVVVAVPRTGSKPAEMQ